MTDWLVISDIHAGDVFVESERGQDALLLALTDAQRTTRHGNTGYTVDAVALPDGTPYTLFQAVRAGGYGLKLYRGPQYRVLSVADWVAALHTAVRVVAQRDAAALAATATAHAAALADYTTQIAACRAAYAALQAEHARLAERYTRTSVALNELERIINNRRANALDIQERASHVLQNLEAEEAQP